jgi:hypothetical protein
MLKDHSNRNAKDINKLLAFRDSQVMPPKTKQNKTKQNKTKQNKTKTPAASLPGVVIKSV